MKPRIRLPFLLPLLVLILATVTLMQPLSVSASSHPIRRGMRPVHHAQIHYLWGKKHYQHRPNAGTTNLVYQGGPVMAGTTQAYAIFWEPTGSYVDPSYNDLLTRYFGDVGPSPLYQNNTQYTDSNGNAPQSAVLTNTWVDTNTPYPAKALTDSDIQKEVVNAMAANGWVPAITNAFFVFTALNTLICDSSGCSEPGNGGFCAYHSAFNLPNVAEPVIYGAMPYDGNDLVNCYALGSSPNGDAAADAEISTTSHEQIEAATDPVPDTGWYDPVAGQEIGDKCAYQYQQINADGSNVSWNNNPYIVQSEWDNTITGCALSGP
jgi:hypothetical protein